MKERIAAVERTFAEVASDEQIERTAKALEGHGIRTQIAATGADAKRMFFEIVPEGAEVFLGASVTLEALGIKQEIEQSGRYDAVRPKMRALDRATQGREIRKLGASPEYAGGSAQAVTEAGEVLIASNTGSQLGPYVSGAGKVIWVVGAQKLVGTLEQGLRRIREYCLPLEEQHMQDLYKMGTRLNKLLIVNGELQPNRTSMIIVKEALGF